MIISIELHLKGHCIQKEAEKEIKRLTQVLMSNEANQIEEVGSKDVGMKIELLRKFLTESNFQKLRAFDERLAGIIDSDVVISEDEEGNIKILVK